MLILPIHEHGISFHFFNVVFNFFHHCLIVFRYKSFTSLVKFVTRYFILSDAVVNWIAFIISLSGSFLLVYKNTTDFCMLILYPVTLWKSLIISNSFLFFGSAFGIVCIQNLICNGDRFSSSFPVCVPFISFSCLTAGASTFNAVFSKGSGNGHLCPLSYLREKAFSCGFVIIGSYYVEVCFFFMHSPEVFIIKGCYILFSVFFCICWDTWFLSFILLMWFFTFIDMHMLNHLCIAGIKPIWSWCITLFFSQLPVSFIFPRI